MTPFRPADEPDFGLAARNLVGALELQERVEDRVATLRELSRQLGDAWYPFYVKLLMVVGEGAPQEHRVLVADAAAHGLQHGQGPGGTLGSWGMPARLPPALAAATAGQGFLRMASARVLDPLAYVLVWFGQSTSRPLLPQPVFERALASLLRLFQSSTGASAIYQAKLRGDIATASDGTFSMSTIARIKILLDGWVANVPPLQLVTDVAAAGHTPLGHDLKRAWQRNFV
jgi:hypothetical protein